MRYFHSLPANLVLQASSRVLRTIVEDCFARIRDDLSTPVYLDQVFEGVAEMPDGPKLRHWLSVSHNLLRAKARMTDPESRLIAHFHVDSMDPDRIAELHSFKALELVVDRALIERRPLSLSLKGMKCPPSWHLWGSGTITPNATEPGMDVSFDEHGSGRIILGGDRFELAHGTLVNRGSRIVRDRVVHTPEGSLVVASTIAGLGSAHHSNAPIISGEEAVGDWAKVLSSAFSLLSNIDCAMSAECLALARAVCPLHSDGFYLGSSSPDDILGLLFLPGVRDEYIVAECLLHECLHQKLCHAEQGSDLFSGPDKDEEIYYSPWRPEGRPLRMLVHGAFVFTGVAHLWRSIRDTTDDVAVRRSSEFHMRYRAVQSLRAMETVDKFGCATSFGKKLAALITEGAREILAESYRFDEIFGEVDGLMEDHAAKHVRHLH